MPPASFRSKNCMPSLTWIGDRARRYGSVRRDDFEPVSPLSDGPISREAPWSRGGRGVVARPPEPEPEPVEVGLAAELDACRATAEAVAQERDKPRGSFASLRMTGEGIDKIRPLFRWSLVQAFASSVVR